MSQTIDQRVVEMRFDNKQFESGAKESISTLDKLKQALRFQDVGKGFENIQKSANSVDMKGLSGAIESVKLKFSGLEVAAITALSNIVNRAVDAGIRLAKSLSIDQITQGFGEYELKMGSIQTIMASTGESLETVNGYLRELNEYSDKTIYSFADMTQNIGKFTNAGVKLEDAVKAIQGISNEAAVSGANTQQASHAMYNFAQALSAGSIRLFDWRSIQNASMDTVEFKNALLDTALAMGTVVKEGDKYRSTTKDVNGNVSDLFEATTMWNESLNSQWLTTEVLVQTLGNYSTDVREMTDAEKEAYEEKLRGIGYTEEQIKAIEELGMKAFDAAQDVKTFSQLIDTTKEAVGSGWAETFELIFGDFEEAKSLWSSVAKTVGDIVKESADSRNEFLKTWRKAGGRDYLLGGLGNAFKGLLSIIKAVKEAFAEVFPAPSRDQVSKTSKAFEQFTLKLKPSEKALTAIKNAFSGLFTVIKVAGKLLKAAFKILSPIVGLIADLAGGVLGVSGSLGEWITKIDKATDANGGFADAVDRIAGAVQNAVDWISDLIKNVAEIAKEFLGLNDINIDEETKRIGDDLSNLARNAANFSLDKVSEAFSNLKEKLQDFISYDGLTTFLNSIKNFGEKLKEALTFENILDRMEKVMDVFGRFFNWIKDIFGPAFENFSFGGAAAAGGGIGIIYAMIKAIKALEKIVSPLDSIPGLLDALKDTLSAYQQDLKADILIKTAGAIAILAVALGLLSFTDTDKLLEASISLSVIASVLLFGVSKFLDAVNEGRELNDALTIFSKGLSKSMKKLASAIKIKAIGSTIKDFAISLAAIALVIVGLGYIYSKDADMINNGITIVGLIGVAIFALVDLAGKVSKFSSFKGIAAIAGVIVGFAASLTMIVGALKTLFKMEIPNDWVLKLGILAGIITALAGVGVVLALAAKLADGNELPKMAGTMVTMAILMAAVVQSLKALFKMELPKDWPLKFGILAAVFKGMIALILVMALAAKLSEGQGIKAAGTLLAMSVLIAAIVGALFVLTIIPFGKLISGSIALGIVLVGVSTALLGASKISDAGAAKTVLAMAMMVIAITGALGVLSMIPWPKLLKAVAFLSATLMALSLALDSASKTDKDSSETVLAMVLAVVAIAVSLYSLAEQPWENLLAAAGSLSAVLLALAGCFAIVSKAEVNTQAIGAVAAGAASLILIAQSISTLAQYDPENLLASCVALGGMLVVITGVMKACSGLSKIIPQAALGVLGLGAIIAEIGVILALLGDLSSLLGMSESMMKGIEFLGLIGKAIGAFLGGIVEGVVGGVTAVLPDLGDALAKFMVGAKPFIEGIKQVDLKAVTGVGFLVGMIGALTGASVITGISKLFHLSLESVGTALSNFMKKLSGEGGFIESVNSLNEGSARACGYLADMIKSLTKSDILSGIGKILGLSGGLGDFGEELKAFAPSIAEFANQVKDVKPESVQGAAAAAQIMSELASNLPAQDGLIQRIFGEKSLEAFGQELVKFGPMIKLFATQVAGMDPTSVNGVKTITAIMSELANNLPESNSLWTTIFGGGTTTLSDFAADLVDFGGSMVEFSNSLVDLNVDRINGAIQSFKDLIDLASYGDGVSGEKLASFADQLNLIGVDCVDNFALAFEGSADKAAEAVGSMVSNFKTAVENRNADFVSMGKGSITQYLTGIKNNYSEATYTGTNLANMVISGLNTKIPGFLTKGMDAIGQFLTGIKNKYQEVTSAGEAVAKKAITGVSSKNNDFYDVGKYAIQGFINGMNSKLTDVTKKAYEIGNAAYEASRRALDEHSPSKKMEEVGGYAGEGFVDGLSKWQSLSNNAGKALGLEALKGALKGVNDKRIYADIVGKSKENVDKAIRESNGDLFTKLVNDAKLKMDGLIPEVNGTVGNIADGIEGTFAQNSKDFVGLGANAATNYVKGFEANIPQVSGLAAKALANLNTTQNGQDSQFAETGVESTTQYIEGIESQYPEAERAGESLADRALGGLNSRVRGFYDLGLQAARGFINAITSQIAAAAAAAAAMAQAAYGAAAGALQIQSPSRKMAELGNYAGLGFINSLMTYISKAEQVGEQVGDATIKGTSSAISVINDFDNFNPVIRPLVDLSDVERSVSDVNRMFSNSVRYTGSLATSASTSMRKPSQNAVNTTTSTDPNATKGETSYQFIQNNYSPKSLSRIEIYRQTRNQFSQFKEATDKA